MAQDINNPNINDPGFRLTTCDGPKPPESLIAKGFLTDFQTENNRPYVVCDYNGFIGQAQYIINVMIIMGVVVAMLGLAYGGWLYVSGVPKNIERAKSIFPKLAIGFILMITAWFIVSQIMIWLTGSTSYLGTGR